MYKLKIINSSVRDERKGPLVVNWIAERVKKDQNFEVEVIDLAEVNLPMMNEPLHPSQRKYKYEHTKRWSAKIDEADAFIFITAEYDFNYPAPLRNAIEYLFHEWTYKPAGIVSYGGISAGTRAANSLKSDLASVKVVPMFEGVHFQFFAQDIKEGEFVGNEHAEKTLQIMLRELLKWAKGLKRMREQTE